MGEVLPQQLLIHRIGNAKARNSFRLAPSPPRAERVLQQRVQHRGRVELCCARSKQLEEVRHHGGLHEDEVKKLPAHLRPQLHALVRVPRPRRLLSWPTKSLQDAAKELHQDANTSTAGCTTLFLHRGHCRPGSLGRPPRAQQATAASE